MKKKKKKWGGEEGREMARVRRSLSRTVVKRTVRITRERLVMTNSRRLINHKTQIGAYCTRFLAPFLHRPCGIFVPNCVEFFFFFSLLFNYSSFKNFRNSRFLFFILPLTFGIIFFPSPILAKLRKIFENF